MQKHIWWKWALLAGAAWVVGACFHSETFCGQSCTCVPSESGDSGKGHVTNTGEELVSGAGDSSRIDPTGSILDRMAEFGQLRRGKGELPSIAKWRKRGAAH